jgi:superfamily II DNA or RNA helicase
LAKLTLTPFETSLHGLVGSQALLEAQEHVRRGQVAGLQWHAAAGRAFGEVGGERRHSAIATLVAHPDAGPDALQGSCTCSAGPRCSHVAALLLTAESQGAQMTTVAEAETGAKRPNPSSWERSLAGPARVGVVNRSGPAITDRTLRKPATVGLQFEVLAASSVSQFPGVAAPPSRISLRPVVPGRNGGWVRTGITWSSLSYYQYGRPECDVEHLRLLCEILALAPEDRGYGYQQQTLFLEDIPSRRIWDLLAQADEAGLPLVQPGKQSAPVTLSPGPAELSVQVTRAAEGLELEPVVDAVGSRVTLPESLVLGDPVHGIAWWGHADEPEPSGQFRLQLAPMTLDSDLLGLLTPGTIQIPAPDEARFLQDYYPGLRRRVPVVAVGDSVDLPAPQPPVLTLKVDRLDGHRVAVSWEWVYAVGTARDVVPLWPAAGSRLGRDSAAEGEVVRRVTEAVGDVPELLQDLRTVPRLAAAAVLGGIAMIRLLNDVIPGLEQMPDVEVTTDLSDDAPTYREVDEAPVIEFVGADTDGAHDWFDLAVTVSVGGEDVPFNELFLALAQHQEHLILPSGNYFSLDREEFRQLAELIGEASALQDAPAGSLRLNRFQAGLWEELERIGVVSGQAAAWQESVRSLSRATEVSTYSPPTGLNATLRPYQLAGFNWLAALFEFKLGGVLADDMGLGKTVQALALICHTRERGLTDAPFLVVAPTSVVPNWAAEAARFAPGLKVATITQAAARRGTDLREAVGDADVVVTSYTLFRLEYDDYADIRWDGLLLDEAQFVKNYQSKSYQCVKRLPASFKLAITGTPMENNLMELWSLLSLTAPGLFASPTRFTDYYRNPIERDRDVERLDQLRRRIRPLMLRRTKEQVANDLPDKQEQVVELDLNPKHRKVYQTHLQRERQKVLGLVGDLTKNRFEIFRSLTLLRQASLDVALIDPKYAGIPSTKLDVMMDHVDDIIGGGHRALIFSQFTRFLGAARERLVTAGVDHCYLDGKTRNRAAVLDEFRSGSAPIFLISLKAGGFGLNLTEADYCLLLDPWWNPATEAQAVDRVHRIGQTKKVMVYRLVAKDTIEEKVMALKAAKAEIFNQVMNGGAFESGALSAGDIRALVE